MLIKSSGEYLVERLSKDIKPFLSLPISSNISSGISLRTSVPTNTFSSLATDLALDSTPIVALLVKEPPCCLYINLPNNSEPPPKAFNLAACEPALKILIAVRVVILA